eukprot:TRINITY_DN7466_c0_g1_i2.p1 TRINITY_DN7466_c0_g1~~TRINITY_DN7466_c0_g1_i2.p1  ORF type:complete len:694 (-),score=183.41 TRINITY_DN7466_c0_g1_i2:121-2202(-)
MRRSGEGARGPLSPLREASFFVTCLISLGLLSLAEGAGRSRASQLYLQVDDELELVSSVLLAVSAKTVRGSHFAVEAGQAAQFLRRYPLVERWPADIEGPHGPGNYLDSPIHEEEAEQLQLLESTTSEPDSGNKSESLDDKVVNETLNDTLKDASDREMASAVAESEAKGDSPIDSKNATAKSHVKKKVEDALRDSVADIKVGNPFGQITEVNASGDWNADKAIKAKVKDAVSRSVREVMQDEKNKTKKEATNESAATGNGTEQSGSKWTFGWHSKEKDRPANHSLDAHRNETGEKIVQEITKKVEKAIDDEVVNASREHREPTEEELEEAASKEIDRIWHILQHAQRLGHHQGYPTGIMGFFNSVQKLDWLVLLATTASALRLNQMTLNWPTSVASHGLAQGIWLALGIAYSAFVFARQGYDDGIIWMNGYILEIIFMLENIFVFHVIVEAFNLSRWMTQRALFVVLVSQIVIQMIFYMGLAGLLRSIVMLPYVLGAWLVYCGYLACVEVGDDAKHMNILDTCFMRSLRRTFLGDNVLSTDVWDAYTGFLAPKSADGTTGRLTMAGLAVIALVLADFLLEIDVTVTKIEAMQNQYLSFSSSVVASFALPELFFETRDLFRRYPGLKYGISFVLVFFGIQMLFHDMFLLSALRSVFISLSAIIISLVLSGGDSERSYKGSASAGSCRREGRLK